MMGARARRVVGALLIAIALSVGFAITAWRHDEPLAVTALFRQTAGARVQPPSRSGWISNAANDRRWLWFQDHSWNVDVYSTMYTGGADQTLEYLKRHASEVLALRHHEGEPPTQVGLGSEARRAILGGADFMSVAVGYPWRCARASWCSMDVGGITQYTVLEGTAVSARANSVIFGPVSTLFPSHVLVIGLLADVALWTLFPLAILEVGAWMHRRRWHRASA